MAEMATNQGQTRGEIVLNNTVGLAYDSEPGTH
jgi:hypothetical protein